MGKALVIKGLVVSNPVGVVTFDADVVSLLLSNYSLSATAGDIVNITATATKEDGSQAVVTFETSNPSVAVVDSVSLNVATINIVNGGSASIIARAGNLTAICEIEATYSAEVLLRDYYQVNTTVNASEKAALNTLVEGLANAGIWTKMKYFYPMLGSTVEDQILDAVSPSTEDIMSAKLAALGDEQTLWSVSNRRFYSNGDVGGNQQIVRAASLNVQNIAMICCGKATGGAAQGIQILGSNSTYYTELDIREKQHGQTPVFISGGVFVPVWDDRDATIAATFTTYRLVCGIQKDGSAKCYVGNRLYSNNADNQPNFTFTRNGNVLSSSSGGNFDFNAIAENLSDAEWITMYGMLKTYLTSLGRYESDVA